MHNHGNGPFDVRLSVAFGSDFADLFEVRGLRRARRGIANLDVGETKVALNYQGLDGKRLRTTMLFDPVPEQLSGSAASYAFELQPNESRSVYVTVKCDPGVEENVALPFRKGLRAAFHAHQTASRGMATITSSNQIFNEVMCRSMADLAMLTTEHGAGPLPLRRHSLVLDHIRPRRDHHGAADVVVRFPYRQGCAAAARRLSSHRIRSARRRRAGKNSCMKCVAAKWRRYAKCRSAFITAA